MPLVGDNTPRKYTVQEFLLTHMSWMSLMMRTQYNKKGRIPQYIGITCDPRWFAFETFIGDMGPRPAVAYTLDRINNSAGYSKENCRWATKQQQARNRRSNHYLTFDGKTATIAEWTIRQGLGRSTISARLRLGWSIERALTVPAGTINPIHVSFSEGRARGKKLTRETVLQIVDLSKSHTNVALARMFHVSDVIIGRIIRQFNAR